MDDYFQLVYLTGRRITIKVKRQPDGRMQKQIATDYAIVIFH